MGREVSVFRCMNFSHLLSAGDGGFADPFFFFFSRSVRLPLRLLFIPLSLFFIEKQNSFLTKYSSASKRQTVHVVVIALK